MAASNLNAGMAAGIQAIPSLIGRIFTSGDQDKQYQAMTDAYQALLDQGAPPDMAQAVLLQQFKQAGKLTPELEAQVGKLSSEQANTTEDASLRNAQTDALKNLQNRGRVGLTAQDRVNLNQVQTAAAKEAEGSREAAVRNFAARGQGGSGAELAAALSGSQGGANTASNGANQVAANASNNALNAISQAGTLGGQIRGQDFSVANTKAQAADQMQRFNTENQLAINRANVERQNKAQAANLAEAQNIANANTKEANTEALRQNAGRLENWQNQGRLAATKAAADQMKAGIYGSKVADVSNLWTGLGQGAGAAYAQSGGFGDGKKGSGEASGAGSEQPADLSGGTEDLGGSFGMGGDSGMGMSDFAQYASKGGEIMKEVPPGYSDGGAIDPGILQLAMMFLKNGGMVPGQAPVAGDSPKNDIVPLMASPGEIIIPRTISHDPEAAKHFVAGVNSARQPKFAAIHSVLNRGMK